MPYLRCASCGVLTYAPRKAWHPPCAGCGLPLDRGRQDVLAPRDRDRRLRELLRLTRELLDTDLALLSRIQDEHEVVHAADGDWAGLDPLGHVPVPLEDTICQRMLDGRIGHYVGDTAREERVRGLRIVDELGIRAWLGVPIEVADMQLYVLCCLAREARPSLGPREVKLLFGLAESVRAELGAP